METATNDSVAERPPLKAVQCLVLDAGPLIKNEPPVSTLLAQAEELYTLPSVISELRDEATRSRVTTTLVPFLKLRNPKPESIKFVQDFARKTGDLEVLSRPDIHLIALTYELEIERNGGDWRLRKDPGQKRVNGKPPGREAENAGATKTEGGEGGEVQHSAENALGQKLDEEKVNSTGVETDLENLALDGDATGPSPAAEQPDEPSAQDAGSTAVKDDEGDDDGWITPSNLKKHQAKDATGATGPTQPVQRVLQAALLTSDYAMQNVSLRMNLNLLSTSMARIQHVKTWVLRCHACFRIERRDMSAAFCPGCGQATLLRTSCSTAADGSFTVHLKRNFQWNNRGNVYSIPKPTAGSANGRGSGGGGGKNGWGRDLILAGDQKEYVRAKEDERRARVRDLMDEDYLPDILSGRRSGGQGKIKVGAGRNVNGKKRR